MKVSICCIGHITLDKIVTPANTTFLPGGTAYYFSYALSKFCNDYLLVTAVAESELASVKELEDIGINVRRLPSKHTVAFENRYSANTDERTQRVWQEADAFQVNSVADIEAGVFHVGPLLADDIPDEIIKVLSTKSKVSLDVQGLLRKVEKERVVPIDWLAKQQLLPYVYFLKSNEEELKTLTGTDDIEQGAKQLSAWGAKEVIITLGSKGSVVYSKGKFFSIPAYRPKQIVDATGCGDTYMAGYLFKRMQNRTIQQAGEFAAAMATLKLEASGPFRRNETEIEAVMQTTGATE